MKIDAEIYGIIPKAKMDAFENAPPTNASRRPSMPPLELFSRLVSLLGSRPGSTMCDPNL